MTLDINAELRLITAALGDASIPYALCGGLAVAIHGFPRFTDDVDLLVREEDLEQATRVLAAIGYTLSAGIIPLQTGTPKEARVYRVSKAVGEDLLTLDLILVSPFLAPVWADRQRFMLAGGPIDVVSLKGLIIMKEAAGRPVDQIDLLHLREDNSQ